MGNPAARGDGTSGIVDTLKEHARRLRELERPVGTNLSSLVKQVELALANITSTVQSAIAALSYTRAETDSRIANPGNVNASGSISVAGDVSAATGRFDNGLFSTSAYSTILTSDYRSLYVGNANKQIGHVPSSIRFKQDVKDAVLDLEKIEMLRLVVFRYVREVEEKGNGAAIEWGLIAEEVHNLGLHWLVYYDTEGRPFGVRYELLALALVPALQRANKRRGFQEVTKTLPTFTVTGNRQDVEIVWDKPFMDTDYLVQAYAMPPTGILTSVNVTPIPGTRTTKGITVRVTTNGIAVASGTTLVVTGAHP